MRLSPGELGRPLEGKNLKDPMSPSRKRGLWLLGLVGVLVLGAAMWRFAALAGYEELLNNALILGLALSGLGGIVYLSLRSVRRNREAHNLAALQHDEALQQVATRLGWQFRPGYAYELPTAGRYEGWGTADGTLNGFVVRVGVATDSPAEGASTFTSVVTVKAPEGDAYFCLGRKGRLRFARKKGKLHSRDVPQLALTELDALATEVIVTPTSLTVTLAPAARHFKSLTYILATQSDVSTILSAIGASTAVAKRLLQLG